MVVSLVSSFLIYLASHERIPEKEFMWNSALVEKGFLNVLKGVQLKLYM